MIFFKTNINNIHKVDEKSKLNMGRIIFLFLCWVKRKKKMHNVTNDLIIDTIL